jgi:hypothetical protein
MIMGIYRKEGKQEAYEDALAMVRHYVRDDDLFYDSIDEKPQIYVEIFDKLLDAHRTDSLTAPDIRQVFYKAVRVERDHRIGKTTMTKKSFDLNAADCEMLAELQTELGHSTEVAALRAAIHALYARTFG